MMTDISYEASLNKSIQLSNYQSLSNFNRSYIVLKAKLRGKLEIESIYIAI